MDLGAAYALTLRFEEEPEIRILYACNLLIEVWGASPHSHGLPHEHVAGWLVSLVVSRVVCARCCPALCLCPESAVVVTFTKITRLWQDFLGS